jgi:hypothetical protein
MNANEIISFYRDLELLEIPSVGFPRERKKQWIREVNLRAERLPLAAQTDIETSEIPYYLVRLGCPRQVDLVRAVSRLICHQEDAFLEERLGGARGALATFTVDWSGRLVEGSFQVAPFVLAAARMAKDIDIGGISSAIDAFEEYAEELLGEDFSARHRDLTIWRQRHAEIERASQEAMDLNDLNEFRALDEMREALEKQPYGFAKDVAPLEAMRSLTDELAALIGLNKNLPILVEEGQRKWVKNKLFPRPPGGGGFTSFYFLELDRISRQAGKDNIVSPVLQTFLNREHKSGERVEVMLDQEEIESMLDASCFAPARWPSSPEHSLSLAQQLGVADALSNDSPVTAVNGPPGTGKTTLLRDVIANKVLERAMRLSELEVPEDAFKKHGDMVLIDADLVAGTEIVVASNGNRAVENVTLEIPRKSEIDSDYFPDAAYLPEVAEAIALAFERPCEAWGSIALVMGKKSNIKTTMATLRTGAKSWNGANRKKGLISILEARGRASPREWKVAVAAFEADMAAFRTIMEHRSARDDDAIYLDPDGLGQLRTEAKRHAVSLWVDTNIEELRAKIFLSALKLHELVLRSSPDGICQFLRFFEDVLSGEAECDEARLLDLWRTLFLVTPVISTTFASAHRLPKQPGWIGCLMIDEAGQATPQSAVPVMQRASKAVIVGDPAQLEPIYTVPPLVIDALRRRRDVPEDLSPARESVQSIADATMRIGGFLPDPRDRSAKRWAGIPLRVHRRCAQPMFDVINTVSYGGKMVPGGDLTAAARRLRKPYTYSQWFDVRSGGGRGHVNQDETACLGDLLCQFRDAGILGPGQEYSAMVVTPFAKVQWACQKTIGGVFGKGYKDIEAGTIHKFQGREADIVFMVLGSASGQWGQSSREWAASNPNLLNVAVSRAKTKLFVIGNYEDWSKLPHFRVLAETFDRYKLVSPYHTIR